MKIATCSLIEGFCRQNENVGSLLFEAITLDCNIPVV